MNLQVLFEQMEWRLNAEAWSVEYRGKGSVYRVQCPPPAFNTDETLATRERRSFACRAALAADLIREIFKDDLPPVEAVVEPDPQDTERDKPKKGRKKKTPVA